VGRIDGGWEDSKTDCGDDAVITGPEEGFMIWVLAVASSLSSVWMMFFLAGLN
jgi:hypothetical protein